MFIIVRYDVTVKQQRAIAELLGQRTIDRDQVRSFLQRSGEQTLEALAMPLVSQSSLPTRIGA